MVVTARPSSVAALRPSSLAALLRELAAQCRDGELSVAPGVNTVLGTSARGVAWGPVKWRGGHVAVKLYHHGRRPAAWSMQIAPHANCVRVLKRYASQTAAGREVLIEIRELCSGGRLFDLLKCQPVSPKLADVTPPSRTARPLLIPDDPLQPELVQVMRWLRQLLSAVSHYHRHNFCCGQIRADHLLLTKGGDIKLSGNWVPHDAASITALKHWTCTDAPELKGVSDVRTEQCFAADVYSIAHLVGILGGLDLTASPVSKPDALEDPPLPRHALNVFFPMPVRATLNRMTAHDPAERPTAVAAFATLSPLGSVDALVLASDDALQPEQQEEDKWVNCPGCSPLNANLTTISHTLRACLNAIHANVSWVMDTSQQPDDGPLQTMVLLVTPRGSHKFNCETNLDDHSDGTAAQLIERHFRDVAANKASRRKSHGRPVDKVDHPPHGQSSILQLADVAGQLNTTRIGKSCEHTLASPSIASTQGRGAPAHEAAPCPAPQPQHEQAQNASGDGSSSLGFAGGRCFSSSSLASAGSDSTNSSFARSHMIAPAQRTNLEHDDEEHACLAILISIYPVSGSFRKLAGQVLSGSSHKHRIDLRRLQGSHQAFHQLLLELRAQMASHPHLTGSSSPLLSSSAATAQMVPLTQLGPRSSSYETGLSTLTAQLPAQSAYRWRGSRGLPKTANAGNETFSGPNRNGLSTIDGALSGSWSQYLDHLDVSEYDADGTS